MSPATPVTSPTIGIPSNPAVGSPITSVTSSTKNFPSPTMQVTENTTHTKFKYPYTPTYSTPPCKSQYANAAQSLLKTVDFKLEDLKNWAILDSGATSHFLITNAPVIDIIPATTPMVVQIPNGERVTSIHTCNLDMPHLPKPARQGHIMPGLVSHSLPSVTKLCDAGCTVEFTMIGCNITYRGKQIVCGKKCTTTGLWMIPITENATANQPPTTSPANINQAAKVILTTREIAHHAMQTSTREELAQYYHQCLLSPPKPTLLQAIDNQPFKTFPGLTYELISKHLPPSTATDKGHMKRRKQNIRSTRSNQQAIKNAKFEVSDMNPPQQMCAALDMFCFAALADTIKGTMYTDLTGKFPVRSYKNNQYVFVAYFYSLNAIIVRPMPNRTDASMVATFKDIIEEPKSCGHQPQLNVMDNECSKAVQQYITSEKIDIQLVEPQDHRFNAAERAIQTFKHHFIAGLATVDIDFPIQLWDEFLPQAQMTLNMLRTSRQDNTKTAYEELKGPFDFNKTPLAPLALKR